VHWGSTVCGIQVGTYGSGYAGEVVLEYAPSGTWTALSSSYR